MSAFRRVQKDLILTSAQTVAGVGTNYYDVSDFRNAVISVATASSFKGSVRIAGAIGQAPPSWANNPSVSNPYAFLQLVDLQDGSTVNGSDSLEIRGTDIVRLYEVNINAVDWLAVSVTTLSAGAVTVKMTVTTNA